VAVDGVLGLDLGYWRLDQNILLHKNSYHLHLQGFLFFFLHAKSK
jgi:hypothetical protein